MISNMLEETAAADLSVHAIPLPTVQIDEGGVIVDCNAAAVKAAGHAGLRRGALLSLFLLPDDENIFNTVRWIEGKDGDKSWFKLVDVPTDGDAIVVLVPFDEEYSIALNLNAYAQEFQFSNENLNEQAAELVALAEDAETARAELAQEIEARMKAEEELKRLASTDSLTGLRNRRAFTEAGSELLKSASDAGEPIAAIMLDLDSFKQVNDTYGHDAGDAVLQAFADVLRKCLRKDDIIGRLGGEEFAVLLPGVDCDAAHGAVQRILETLRATPIDTPSGPLDITTSAGMSFSRLASDKHKADDLETLLKRCDQALYEAKKSGRDQYIFVV